MLHDESATILLRESCTLREKKLGRMCPVCDMPSFAPCLHEEADARIFARDTEAAKRPNMKISSCVVYTDIVVLVIPVVQQL